MKSLIEALQLSEISDLLAKTITSEETNIDLYSSDIQPVNLAQSSDSLEFDSAGLSNLDHNSSDDPRSRRGRNTVTDLSAIAILPTANAGFTGNSYLDGILGSNYWNTGRDTDDEEKLKQALENHIPIQEVSFNPLTGQEEVISWEQQPENLQLLDKYLASAGFDGIDGLLTSLDSPTEFGKQFNSIATNENNSFNEIVFDNSINPESVFGVDNRTQITNTTDYPWSSIARIEVQFSNGTGGFGSGAMISPYHILTAGHVVHDASAGGWATDIDVFLAQDGSEQFYGEADWTYLRSYTGWTNSQSQDHDWALITLDRNIGNFTGWLGYEWRSNSADYNGMTVNTAGYPGDLSFNAQDMYFASGPVAFADTHQLYYNGTMDTFGGQSGSPVWRYNSSTGERYINAVHAYGNGGNGYNEGTRITQTKFNSLQNWISEDDGVRSPIDRSDLVDYDDWFDTNFAYFSSSTVTPGDNITLRSITRNNGTATAGNFDVSFYASTNSIISTGDYFIGKANISSLDAFSWTDAIWTGNFPNIPAGNYYVGWLIDSGNSQTEFLENNNTGIISNSLLTVSESDIDFENQQTDTQGTPGNDVLSGTPNNDTIDGLAGNNTIDGGAGKDRINGRGGDDTIIGGNGKDILTGGSGSDRFVYTDLTDSLRTGYDKVKDFNANGTDLFITSVARADFVDAGAVASLSNSNIRTALNTAGFNADFAAFFTFGTREFIAINDSNTNFQQATDAIIEVTGFTGSLALEDFSVM